MKKGAASVRAGGMDEQKVPWGEEYPESHVRQLNAPRRGAAEELGDLLEHRIGNWKTKLAYSLWGINAPGRIKLTSGTWLSPAHISLAVLNRSVCLASSLSPFLTSGEKVRSCWREHPHLVIGLLVHANPKKLSRTSHMQGNLHVWFWPGFPEVSNNLASARRWRTSPNYCPFILE